MSGVAVFVAMTVIAGVALALVALGATLVLRCVPPASLRSDEVLPGHYASLVQTSSSTLPESRDDRPEGAVNGVLGRR